MEQSTFLKGRILPSLLRFSIPLMMTLILQALYGAVDLVVVGHFGTTASVAAVATGSQVMQSLTVIITGLTMGVTVLLGQAVGARDEERAAAAVAGQIKVFAVVTVFLTLFMLLFAGQTAALMHTPEEAVPQMVLYVRICSAGMIFITAYNAISGIFRGIGDSKSPFLFVSIACVINIVLDLLFVGAFHWDAAGAALATILAQAVSVLFSVFYIRRAPLPFRLTRASFRIKHASRRILGIGAPIALQDFLLQISFLMITSFVNALGLVASASIGIAEKLFVFLSIVPMSLLSALSVFVAQNTGAGQSKRAFSAVGKATAVSFSWGFLIFLSLFFAGQQFAAIFADNPAVIAGAASYLKGCSFEHLFLSISFCLLGYFNGLGRTTFVMIQGIVTAFLIRVPLSYYLSRLPDTNLFLISLAVPISVGISLLFCLLYLCYLRRRDQAEAV